MDLTPEVFEEFLTRLRYHHRGKGVDDHCTAHPIFTVQTLRRHTGIDLDYDPDYYWTDSDYETEMEYDDVDAALREMTEEGIEYKWFDPHYDDTVLDAAGNILFQKVGYAETWEYVNSHFTREAAERFIERKKHDHRELRIYVDSQYWCPEFNAIVDGLLSGKIGLL